MKKEKSTRRKKNYDGLGTVFKLKGRRRKPYVARKPAVVRPDGSRYRETIGTFETYTEAYQALLNPSKNYNNKTTLAGVFSYYKKTNEFTRLSAAVQARYENYYSKFEDLHHIPMKNINYAMLKMSIDQIQNDGYIVVRNNEEIQKYYSKDSLVRMVSLLRLLFDEAIKLGIVSNNLAELITITAAPKSNKKFNNFTHEEINKMFKLSNQIPELKVVLFNIFTGLRPLEMVKLERRHVDLKNRYISGMGVKTEAGKARSVPLCSRILPIAKELYIGTEKYIVGRKMSTKTYRTKLFYPALKAAGIRKRVPYACRDTFASLLNSANVDKESITQMMGHTKYSTTSDNYIAVDLHKNLIEVEKISNL